MNELKFYLYQNPVEPIVFEVRDERGFARNLSAYDNAEVLIAGPNGFMHADCPADILDAANGIVSFEYEDWSVFVQEGKYKLQLKLNKDDRSDYADAATISVERGLDH